MDQIERPVGQRIAPGIMTPHLEGRVAEGFEKPRVDVCDYDFPIDANPVAQPGRDGPPAAAELEAAPASSHAALEKMPDRAWIEQCRQRSESPGGLFAGVCQPLAPIVFGSHRASV